MAGFEYVGTDSGDSGVRIRTYHRPSTDAVALALGDGVKINGTAHTDGTPQVVGVAADTQASITGIVVGFEPSYANESLSSVGLAASTAGYIRVMDDSRALFEVEASATLAVTDVGANIGFDYTATTVSGNLYTSNAKVDQGNIATTATYPFQIVKLLKGATSGTLGDRALVRLNASTVAPGATGV
jgi:hypothetical protein